MAIDLQADTLLTLQEAVARLPGRPHISTIHRWRLNGVRGIKLQTCLVGGRRFVKLGWLEEFASQLTDLDGTKPNPVGRCHQASEKAAEELTKDGV